MTARAVLAVALLVAAASPLAPAPARAQQVPTLDRVDSLLAAGAYDDARATLERWWSARESFDVPGSDNVRATMLRARLQTDPAAAETDYLNIVIGNPTSPYAPEALLRLGQGLLARGQAARAAAYLQRLAVDYPGHPQRPLGMLWLARAQDAARNHAGACRAARDGLLDATNQPDLAAMLRLEEAATCALGAGAQTDVATPRPRPAEERPPAAPAPAPDTARPVPAPPAATGDWAVQAGAFRYRDGAEALMARLRDAGFEPRAVLVPRNTLLRIRVGRFATDDEARRLMETIRRAGFEAVVVNDAAQERVP